MEPPRQWTQAASSTYDQRQHPFHNVDMDLKTRKNLLILNHILHNSNTTNLPTADLHDLACFVLHRLLASIPVEHVSATPSSLVTNSAQYAAALYMLVLHGPTYFSHAFLQHKLIAKLQSHLEALDSTSTPQPDTLLLWLVSVGLVASQGTPEAEWFINQASSLAGSLQLFTWSSILSSLKSILWLDRPHAALMFQNCWEDIFSTHTHVIP